MQTDLFEEITRKPVVSANPMLAGTPVEKSLERQRKLSEPVQGVVRSLDRYLSVKEIAAMIGCHPMTVYGWIREYGMPIRRASRTGRISVVWRDFQEWWSAYKG